MIFTLDEPLHIVQHVDPRQPPGSYQTLAGGLHTSPALITHDGAQSGIQLRLSPLGARALLGMPAGELTGIDLDAAEVFGPVANEIHERLRQTASWPERFTVLDRILRRHMRRAQDPAAEIGFAWRCLLRSGGAMPISDLAREVGWSDRHLASRFRTEIGLTPKTAARVIRFHRARRTLQAHAAGTTLADIAAWCGVLRPVPPRARVHAVRRLPAEHLAPRGGRKYPSHGYRGPGTLGVMTDTTTPPQVWPTLRARDARALIRFLVDVLGFEETAVYGEGARVDHAQLSWPVGGGIMLGSARDDPEDSWPLQPGTFGAYVVTDNPDELFARVTAAGAEVLQPLHDTDYGSRDFTVRDPEGNRWSFGTYRGETRTSPS